MNILLPHSVVSFISYIVCFFQILIIAFTDITAPQQFVLFQDPNDENQVLMGHRKFASRPEGWLGSVSHPDIMTPLFRICMKNAFPPASIPINADVCAQSGFWEETNQSKFERDVYPILGAEAKVHFWTNLFANRELALLGMMDLNSNKTVQVSFVPCHQLITIYL